jgi:hypothetical protein
VDKYLARTIRICSGKRISTKTTADTRMKCATFTLCFICVARRKSAATNFLSCTKNIELTQRAFTRTFSFAFSAKLNPAEDRNRPEAQRDGSAARPSVANSLHQTLTTSES